MRQSETKWESLPFNTLNEGLMKGIFQERNWTQKGLAIEASTDNMMAQIITRWKLDALCIRTIFKAMVSDAPVFQR